VGSQIIAIDLAPIKPMPGVTCIQSDITTEKCRSLVRKELKGGRADVVLHDGAPNVGSTWSKDAFSQAELTLHSLRLACDFLKAGGTFVTKVFRSADYNSLLWVFNQLFNKVDATKPTASRNVSAEIFVMCIGFKAGKIDPRFFDTKWVFMENLEPLAKDEGVKKPGASLTEYFKQLKKKHRGGYEEGDDRRIVPAHEFVAAENPAEILIKAHQLNLDAPGSEPLRGHPLTTQEIRDFCGDLKVLGKGDLAQLLKWRAKLLREQEKKEREAEKKAKEDPSTLALRARAKAQATQAAAKKAVDRGLAADVDDAIAKFLDGEDAELKGAAAAAEEASTEDEEEDDRLEQQLKDQIDKRRKEDRKEAKRMMDRQRKQEWRKKMSLATGRGTPDDASELFKVTDRSVQALQEDSALPEDCISEDLSDEPKELQESSDSEADDQMDRLARMEVDLALDHELRKAELTHKHRNSTQRAARKKKETRRQRVMQAWAGELTAFNEALQGEAKAQALENADQDAVEDGSDSEEDLKALRNFQAKLEKAEDSDAEGLDADALAALAEGPDGEEEASEKPVEDFQGSAPRKKEAKEKLQKGREQRSQGRDLALEDGAGETALVPVDEEEVTRGEHRAFRWFSQDIFSGLSAKPRGAQELDEAGEAGSGSEGEGGQMRELSDAQLPKLPLTDKEKRRIKRKKDLERLEKLGIKPKSKQKEEEKGSLEVAPLEAPKSIVSTGPTKPSDPRELAETMALGSLLVESKKSRMELLDAAYNRWTFDPNEALPVWFTEEEEKYNKPELPISKEAMAQFRAKLREINARPIRKVAEARARKKRRLAKKLEKLRSTAMALSETTDMSETAKARQMRKAVNKLAKQDQRKVTTVAIKKGGGGHKLDKKKAPKGAKVKVVDRRMKADLRGQKKAQKRNPGRFKLQQRKMQQKINKGKRRGKGDKGDKKGKRQRTGGAE
ncbi:SPB1, partial [Symbiodinium sp. KB8]